MSKSRCSFALSLGVLALACHTQAAVPAVKSSEPIGALPSGLAQGTGGWREMSYDTIKVSPDGKHIAYEVALGSRVGMVVDGKTSGKFDAIVPFLNGAAQWPSVPSVRVVATGDQSHTAFLAKRGQDLFAVVDGVEIALEAGSVAPPEAMFSADGSSFAFIMTQQNGPACVMLNGKPTEKYAQVRGLTLSADGKHVAFVATVEKDKPDASSRYESFVVIDGKPGPKLDVDTVQKIVFSADGSHYAYTGRVHEAGMQLFVDGESKATGDLARFLQMSPDGRHVCCAIGKNVNLGADRYGISEMRWSVWYDGQLWPWAAANEVQLDQLFGKPQLNAAGDHVVYVREDRANAAAGAVSKIVVVDGKDGQAYTSVSDVRFAGEGPNVRYVAVQKQGDVNNVYVVDGADEAGPYLFEKVKVIDNPDRTHTAYIASKGTEAVVAHDGKIVGTFPSRSDLPFNDLVLSRDGAHLAYVAAGGFYIDGKCVSAMDNLPTFLEGGRQHSEFSADASHVTTSASGVMILLDGAYASKGQLRQLFAGHFTTDSKHLFFQEYGQEAAVPRGTSRLVVDGKTLSGLGIIGAATPLEDGTISAFAVDVAKNEVVRVIITPGDATDFGLGGTERAPVGNEDAIRDAIRKKGRR